MHHGKQAKLLHVPRQPPHAACRGHAHPAQDAHYMWPVWAQREQQAFQQRPTVTQHKESVSSQPWRPRYWPKVDIFILEAYMFPDAYISFVIFMHESFISCIRERLVNVNQLACGFISIVFFSGWCAGACEGGWLSHPCWRGWVVIYHQVGWKWSPAHTQALLFPVL